MEDSEFSTSGKVVGKRMDLVAVVVHELGHIVGLDDDHAAGVMGDSLTAGTRRVPTPWDVRQAVIAHADRPADPVTVAAMPAVRRRPARRR